ncbi:MAG TPA: GFA family protein [Solirubrobacterales bacterium]
MDAQRQLTGGCRCGAVRYTVADAFEYGAICHCSECRKTTGSASKPFLGIRGEELQVHAGSDDLVRFGDEEGHDTRCRRCGCFLYSVVRQGEYVHVAMGSLIDEPTMRPNHHIFVASKADWDEIEDDLPQFDEYGY